MSNLLKNRFSLRRCLSHFSSSGLSDSQVMTGRSFGQGSPVSEYPVSIISESYQTIRTALLLSQPEGPPRVILVTSARPGDGKTVTVLNLALALVQGGHSVLVVDADLRKGCCHERLGLRNNQGLSNLLTGHLTLEQSIDKTSIEGLSLCSRGIRPPNPTDLLASHKMEKTLGLLRERFDFILIDSPSAIAVSDAVVLSQFCDGVIAVLHGQETTVKTTCRLVTHLEMVRARILGVVLNGVDIRSLDYADYRSYYTSYYAELKSNPDHIPLQYEPEERA